MVAAPQETRAGIGVDANGRSVIDPTKNVDTLVASAVAAAADLRVADTRFNDAMRAADNKYWSDIRQADLYTHRMLRDAEHQITALHMEYGEQMRDKEAERLDAIREGATTQAAELARQLVASTEQARRLVETTATAYATQVESLNRTVSARLDALEQSKYIAAGRTGVTDPAIAELAKKVEQMLGTKTQGMSAVWGYIVGGVGLMGVLLTIFYTLMRVTGKVP